MKKLAFSFALLLAGLITFGAPATAQAHSPRNCDTYSHVNHRRHHRPAIRVKVYERVHSWVWDSYYGRWVWREHTVARWVTAHWHRSYGCYGYHDRYGYFRCVRS